MSSKIEAWAFSRALCRGRAILAGGGAKFFRDLSVLVGGQIAARLIGFLAFAYLARRLDPEAYGSVEFIVGLAGLFSTMVDLGLGTIGIRRAAAAPGERPLLAAQISVIRFCIAFICALAMIISVGAASNSPILHGLVLLYAASLLLGAWYQEWLLQSAALMAQVAFAQMLRMSVFFLVIVLLVRDSGDALLVGWGEIAAVAAAAAYSLYVQQHRIAPIRFLASVKTKDLIREAIPVGLSNAVWSAAQYAPLFLMGAIVGGSDTGIFAGANRLVASIATFSFVYHFNLYAAAARAAAEDHTALVALMRNSFRVVAWATIGGALGLSLAAAPILGIVFGPDFEISGARARDHDLDRTGHVPVRPCALVAHSGEAGAECLFRASVRACDGRSAGICACAFIRRYWRGSGGARRQSGGMGYVLRTRLAEEGSHPATLTCRETLNPRARTRVLRPGIGARSLGRGLRRADYLRVQRALSRSRACVGRPCDRRQHETAGPMTGAHNAAILHRERSAIAMRRPLRIAMVTTFYPPYNFGGDGQYVRRLAHALVRRGHEVDVIHDADAYRLLGGGAEREPLAEPKGLTVHSLRSGAPALSCLATQQLGRPLVHGPRIRKILGGGFDVIHFHNISLVGGPGILSYGEGIKLYTAHEYWLVCPMHILWRHNRELCTGRQCWRCALAHKRPPQLWRTGDLLTREARHIDAFIALSRFSAEKHAEFGFTAPMVVCPSFLPDISADEGVQPAPERKRPYVLFVGRLEAIKGLQEVIPAFDDKSSRGALDRRLGWV